MNGKMSYKEIPMRCAIFRKCGTFFVLSFLE